MKRNYLFYWFAVLLLLFTSARSYAEVYSGSCGANVNWTLDTGTGLLEITGSGKMEDYDYGYDDAPWYNYSSNIKECVIENSVTSIGKSAFFGCTGLTSITIPEGVTSIGSYAFYNCTGLTSITIPNSVTSIGGSAFAGTPWLNNQSDGLIYIGKVCYDYKGEMPENTTIIIKEGTTGIGGYAFSGCTGLTSITIPESLTSIGECAFYGCTGLTSITIPEGVTSIGDSAFSRCTGLTSITWNAVSCTSFNSGTFYGIKENITSFTFGDKVQTIPANLCSGMSNLTNITIPESVTSIGNYAFGGCTGLTSITWNAVSCTSPRYNAFDGINENITSFTFGDKVQTIPANLCSEMSNLTNITIPESVTSIGKYAFRNCTGLTSINIPEGVTSIGEYAFSGCTGLTSINIPEGVTSIGEYAFSGCTGLTSITWNAISCTSFSSDTFDGIKENITSFTFGDKVQTIPANLCYGMSNLTNITIPEGVTSIGNYAFYYCTGLTSITIPEGVTSIGGNAFYYCTGLTSITIPESVTSIGYEAFRGCSGLTSINIPEGVTSIGYEAFEGCTGLTSINIPEGVTSIEKYTFSGCTGLTSITIPESVTSIGNYAFSGCTGLTSITWNAISCTSFSSRTFDGIKKNITSFTFGDKVQTIPANLCSGMSKLTNITIPNSVTSIGDYAFSNCTRLTDITIGNSVTSIGEYAFCNCTGLTSINIPEGVTSIGERAFYGCTGLTSITISESVTSIGEYAFYDCTGLTSITIPENVTSIGEYAFRNCSNLKTIVNLSDLNITKGSSYNGYVAYYANKVVKADTQVGEFCFEETTDGDKLVGYIGNESEVTLPEEYDGKNYGIGDYAFFDCPNLNTVVLSKGINEVEPFAFTDNKGITVISSINVAADNEYFCSEDGILFSKDMTRLVRFPEGKEGSSYSIPETVTSIADNAFHKCTTLSSITVSANATSVGSGAFSDCSTITSISIPDNVTSIGAETFAGCSSLRIVELGRSVATIGADAFKDCSKMRQIKCYSLDPPLCEDGALSGLDTWDCSLFIPEGTESLYKAADQWKEFFFIEEITGIDTPKVNDSKNTTYDIYDMSGRTVRKAATTTDGLKAGLYIINGRKVLVK